MSKKKIVIIIISTVILSILVSSLLRLGISLIVDRAYLDSALVDEIKNADFELTGEFLEENGYTYGPDGGKGDYLKWVYGDDGFSVRVTLNDGVIPETEKTAVTVSTGYLRADKTGFSIATVERRLEIACPSCSIVVFATDEPPFSLSAPDALVDELRLLMGK